MAVAKDELEMKEQRVLSLPQLQSLMKRDPEAYRSEFDQQWSHFESMLEMFKLKPQKPSQTFGEQVMFMSHVCPSFPDKSGKLPEVIISALSEHDEVMHPQMRQTLVQALILQRNRDQFPCIKALPLYFRMFRLQDKTVRSMIFSHVIRDLVHMNRKNKSQKTTTELIDFFFAKLTKEADVEISRRACAVFISMFRQNVWKDARVVNLMSSGLLHSDLKVAAALAHLFLGNKTKGLEGILEEDEEDDEKETMEQANEAMFKGVVGAKKTANRMKKVARAKRAAKKVINKKRSGDGDSHTVSYLAIDLLHDPQALSERLHKRISKGGEPFLFRLLLLHLLARIIGRNQLQLLNLYPYLLKYLQPTQKDVTKILACLVEACHDQVPPEELKPTVTHIIQTFVTEAQAPEVIEVGLNTIREICVRSVNVLNEDELTDLTGFRKFKHKGVAMAARGLINAYRELHPQLLHRSLQGRTASVALSRGELQAPIFGSTHVADGIDGLDMLLKKKSRDHDADDAEQKPETAQELMTEQVLSTEELQKARKLRLQKSIELQLGRKRHAVEMSDSNSGSDSDSDAVSDEEAGLFGRVKDGVSGDMLKGAAAKPRSKQARVEAAKSGFDFKEKIKDKLARRKGGKTNKEQARNKPQIMSLHSGSVQKKKKMNARQKVGNLKKHINTLKTKCKQKRRRA
eukprot:TRINITY_DN22812_c0_g1_i1.p1 TRINITY_DN22812_c0_g1~~TRINITY_DN22812_c0_g1_i1.p1  ORF type:complete len:727 (+),score=194.96 TRINITY_DN22812_c0_g1_i1:123-2183(+)